MNAETDAFAKDLIASFDELASLAPPGPSAASMDGLLRRRRNRRVGGVATALLAVSIIGAAVFMRSPEAQPSTQQQVAEAPQAASPQAQGERPAPSPYAIPTISLAVAPEPGPGSQGRLSMDMPSLSMPSTVAGRNPTVSMPLVIPRISMPSL